MIPDGITIAEIAEAKLTSNGRVQDIVEIALLAPDDLKANAAGG